jgi:hypothetical protein
MRAYRLLAASLLLAGTASAADSWTGAYIVGGGVGGIDCRNYAYIMNRAERLGVGSPGYNQETYNFGMYVSGFRTGYNLQTADTCDIFGRFSNEQLLTWVKYYCQSYPDERFGGAVVALAQGLYPGRQRNCQPAAYGR